MIKITIVEDHTLFREGIKSLLGKVKDFRIAGEFSDGKKFTDALLTLDTDIVLMDINMPYMNGLDATQTVMLKRPEIKVLVLSMYDDTQYYYKMIRAGAAGFVLKDASPDELETAIRNVHKGLGFFSPSLLRQAVLTAGDPTHEKKRSDRSPLSEREEEVLSLICQGLSNNEVSEKLFISHKTVETHKTNLLKKTATKNTAGLIIYAIKHKLIQI